MKISVEAVLIIICFVALYFLLRNNKGGETTVIRYDSTRSKDVVIYNMQPSQVTKSGNPQQVPVNYDSLRSMFVDLYKQLNEVNQYDTTFKDSLSIERLKFTVTGNKLKEFSRQLTVINKTTETIKNSTARLYGGTVVHSYEDQTNLALGLTYRSRADYLFSVGKDLTGRGWFASVMMPIK